MVRPRVLWDDGQGQSFFLTLDTTLENRHGGTQPGSVLPATGRSCPEALETQRFDIGVLWQILAVGRDVVTARATPARQWHDHRFGEVRERDRHSTGFVELTLRGSIGAHTWVGGLAVEQDAYDPTDLPHFAFTHMTPGAFVQDDIDIGPWQTRWDDLFLRPERAADGRWTIDAWAPLDGRVINGGVRVLRWRGVALHCPR